VLRRALLSVSAKEGIVALARGLTTLGVEVLSTGGTAKALQAASVPVVEVSDFTGSPEILGGRVKTLHPKVHAGILARRDLPEDLQTLDRLGFGVIDLVAVNLYPFEAQAARPGVTEAEIREQIDIGGPTLIRAAAKTWPFVTVLVDPADYATVLDELRSAGEVSSTTRRRLALHAFRYTARYDAAIARQLGADELLPQVLPLALDRAATVRYGENPHQEAAIYQPALASAGARVHSLGGKELSFNNWLDLDAAFALAIELERRSAVVVKHGCPCGAAGRARTLAEAAQAAIAGDPVSAYGGVVGLGDVCDPATAQVLTEEDRFFEVIVAPTFEPEAATILRTRRPWGKNLRLVEMGQPPARGIPGEDTVVTPSGTAKLRAGVLPPIPEVRTLYCGTVLAQRPDSTRAATDLEAAKAVTARPPTTAERDDLGVAWTCAKYLRSNAIAVVKDGSLVGACGGQPSRVEATRIALERAGPRARGAALASDGFFPFPDSVELAARAGVAAVVQPGGSKRDGEVAGAADAAGMTMLITGIRHFRH